LKASTLGDTRQTLLSNTNDDPGSSSKHADEWARQLAAMLAPQAALAPPSNLGSPAPPATGTENGTAASTPRAQGATPSAAVGPQISDAGSDNRLTLTVSTPELGQVSIVIDRAEGGVRVVLGVGGDAAEHALEPEKAALVQSLRGVGLDVHSVNVVQQSRVGTLLAQPPVGRTSLASAKDKNPQDDKQAALRKKHKRIDLIG